MYSRTFISMSVTVARAPSLVEVRAERASKTNDGRAPVAGDDAPRGENDSGSFGHAGCVGDELAMTESLRQWAAAEQAYRECVDLYVITGDPDGPPDPEILQRIADLRRSASVAQLLYAKVVGASYE